jgi:hypothetical protein
MHNRHESFDETFDEKTFNLELRSPDPRRREVAQQAHQRMASLASLRARDNGTSIDDELANMFDPDLLRAEMIGSNKKRAKLAEQVMNNFIRLLFLRIGPVSLDVADRHGGADAY